MRELEAEARSLFEDGDLAAPLDQELRQLEADEPAAEDDDLLAERHPGLRGLAQEAGSARDARRPAGADGEASDEGELLRGACVALTRQQRAQVVAVEDVLAVDAEDGGLLAHRPGGDHDLVGGERADQVGRDLGLEPDLDAELPDLDLEPVEQSLVRLVDEGREAQRAAELARLLAQDDVVAPQPREARRLEPRRTAADDEDALLARGAIALRRADPALAPGHRIDGTAHGAIEEGLGHAGVTVDAGADVLGPALGDLLGDGGIGEKLARHRDHVGLALLDQPVAELGLDPSDGDDGHLDPGLDPRRLLDVARLLVDERRLR
jgi:hypothetical protein